MPRIQPADIRRARSIDVLLEHLLPVCRDFRSAQNELRWLGEHASKVFSLNSRHHEITLRQRYVNRRAKGEPLQYILGTEYFGELEIKCRPGVLIPRQETAASVSYLAQLISRAYSKESGLKKLSVLDLCTGSGCIPLHFHHELSRREQLDLQNASFVGVDVSPIALELARENLETQTKALTFGENSWKAQSLRQMQFIRADILHDEHSSASAHDAQIPPLMDALRTLENTPNPSFDVLISNPPYISSTAFRRTTASSVRRFEPKLALVPPSANDTALHDGDLFYPRLLHLADELNTKISLFEVADMQQAERVAKLAVKQGVWDGVEIWRDDPAALPHETEDTFLDGQTVKVLGQGHGRSVFVYRGNC